MKADFKLGTKVKIHSTTSDFLDENTGKILGKSFEHAEMDHYIVLLDNPTPSHLAICLTEHCLRAL